ncbi:DUF3918 family protein [Ectobacillus ponti]|uniref:YrzQ family protein n=1 Tax=Ectobacillus ponti TaxID=2961894 RepID=A0AA42BMV5_9BACI|nr:DUF3918 family protein [Ectobacillus ponti]MCP8967270.1 YrzQ family protein [Ectobacillus ponti]
MNVKSSLVAMGLGAAAYHYARKSDVFSAKTVKKARKAVKSYF